MRTASANWLRHFVFIVAGVCALTTAAHATPQDNTSRGSQSDASVLARANALLAEMTTDEKAGQLRQYFYIAQFPPLVDLVKKYVDQGAGSLLFISNAADTNSLQRQAIEHSRLHIPLIFGFDVVHGLRTIFPVPIGMAASWDPEMVEHVQTIAAEEARAVGIDWTFSPMVDIARDPRWGRIVEGAGEDPYLGSAMAAAQVRGFQGPYIGSPEHIIAGPKHFAGYGAVMGGRDYDEVDLSDSELWNVYLPPFKAAIDAGAGNIMSAYTPLNGVPATGNHWLLTEVLRDTWGFKGFVVSDSGSVIALTAHGLTTDPQSAGVRALQAGVDMEMAPPGDPGAFSHLPSALQAGQITQNQLDDAVRRVLVAKIRMGLFEHPYVDEARAKEVLNDPAHVVAARIAAERSAVLLRNENGLLPLDRNRTRSIAVIGPLADSSRDTLGPWVFGQDRLDAVTVLAGIHAKVSNGVRVDYSEGVRMPPRTFRSPFEHFDPPRVLPPLDETAEIKHAVALAKRDDVAVLVLGEAQDMIGEDASRASLDLPGRQQELLDAVVATGKPVVVLLMSGRPLDLKQTHAGAIMEIWYPGSQGGPAVANLLFGDANPAGRLPFSWLHSAGQAPVIYSRLTSQDTASADKRYWDGSSAPTYPFGFGLSYTSFKYANLHVENPRYAAGEPVSISVDVSNTGQRPGDEVAQLYIHQRSGTSVRPVRELKGFQRVSLQPGETKTLHFALKADDLHYWSSVTRSWVNDESTFDVWVGGSSAASLAATFDVRHP